MSARRSGWAAVVAVGVAVAALAGVAPAGAGPVGAPAQDGGTAGDAAILDLVGCVQGSKHLAVVFLIDESRSLRETDPDGRRVDAAHAALDGLTTLAAGAGARRTSVDVSFAAFADRYRPVRGWTSVTPANRGRLDAAVASFRTRDGGVDTDLVNALTGAGRALADRTAAVTGRGEAAPCQAVFLFTDGEYDLSVRTAETAERLGRTKPYAPGVAIDTEAGAASAEAAGREELCRPGGLADDLRGDDVTLLTLALTDAGSDAQAFLTALTTGAAGDLTCGTPTDTPPGAYLGTGDVDLLIARFDEVAVRLAGGTLLPSDRTLLLCGLDPCAEGTRPVRLDPSVRRLRLLVLAAQPGAVVEVTGPAGSVVVREGGDQQIGPVTVRATTLAGRGFGIDLRRPDDLGAWSGGWSVRVLDPGGAQVGEPVTLQAYAFSDLGVALDDDATLTRGEAGQLRAELLVPEGVAAADLLATAEAVVRLDDPGTGRSATVALTGPATGPFTGTFTPPADLTASAYEASVELRATTEEGAAIVARSAPTWVTVRRPEGSIQLRPDRLALPTLEGGGASTAELVVVGGGADGCVWFEPGPATVPEGAGALTVSVDGRADVPASDCIPVAAGETRSLPVELRTASRARGAVRGVLEVHARVDGGEDQVTDVPFHLEVVPGVDQGRRLVLAAALLAAGLALPLALLVLINARTARFQQLDAVRGAVIPVRVGPDGILRTDALRPQPLAIRAADFASLVGTGGARRFTFGGVELRVRPSRNPFGHPAALAAPLGGAERLKGGSGRRVALDPALAGSWLFLLDPDRTRRAGGATAEGNLLLFLAEGDAEGQLLRLQGDVDDRLPGIAGGLADAVRTAPADDPPSG